MVLRLWGIGTAGQSAHTLQTPGGATNRSWQSTGRGCARSSLGLLAIVLAASGLAISCQHLWISSRHRPPLHGLIALQHRQAADGSTFAASSAGTKHGLSSTGMSTGLSIGDLLMWRSPDERRPEQIPSAACLAHSDASGGSGGCPAGCVEPNRGGPPLWQASGGYSQAGFEVWGGSVVRGDDGMYHMFASRWPSALGHNGWATSSEVVRARAPTAAGPYTFEAVVLPRRGAAYWDGMMTHNPTIRYDPIRQEYALWYIGLSYDFPPPSEVAPTRAEYNQAWNGKRVGVATSKSLEGPW